MQDTAIAAIGRLELKRMKDMEGVVQSSKFYREIN